MHILNIEYAYIKYRKEKNVRLIQRVHAKYNQRYLVIVKKEYAYIKYRKEKNVRLIQRVHAKYDQRYLVIIKKSMHILNI